jgi:tRNA nucleotidyltransferase (CCA-adding enzyme)
VSTMNTDAQEVEKKVLEKIKPSRSDEETLKSIANLVVNELDKFRQQTRIDMKISVEGSFAKGTWLKTDPELDVFIILPNNYNKEFIKNELYPKLRAWLNDYSPLEQYSEHPYLTLQIHGVKVDIVPSIESLPGAKILTAVDRTHLHTEYVKRKTDEKLRDEIRLTKAFARGIGVYGAEIKIKGFSGYLLELLTIYYGGFRRLLEVAANEWIPGKIYIDIEGVSDQLQAKQAFGNPPMIVIDPTDPKRNVAAAVSMEKLSEFIMAARLYLSNPKEEFFFPKPLHPVEKRRLLGLAETFFENVVLVELRHKARLPPDTLWGELQRALSIMKNLLEKNEFEVYSCDAWSDEKEQSILACLLSTPIKTKYRLIKGPPIKEREHSIRFIEKYLHSPFLGPWIVGDRLYAINVRKEVLATSLIEDHLGEILVSDLTDSTAKVSLLSWRSEIIEDEEISEWILSFLLGKPKWLWALLDYQKV